MTRMYGMVFGTVLALLASGCGKPAGSDPSAGAAPATNAAVAGQGTMPAKLDGPAGAVAAFLEAVRTGNDKAAAEMLSTVARQKTAALNRSVTPPASDTAKYTVGKVDYVSEDGARVACTWTDLDADGQPKTDEAIWVVRRETNGWRIAGVAAQVFPDEPPLLLNFEDPEDMFRKQQWVREEMRRRMAEEDSEMQAQGGEKPETTIRR